MVRTEGGRTTLSCCIERRWLEALRTQHPALPAGAAVLEHVMASCDGVGRALDGAVQDGPWLAAGPIRPGIRPRYEGGIFRVGNCAGEAHPIVAEGISMAIQSGGLLGSLLVASNARNRDRLAVDAVGADYSTRWKRFFAPRIRAAAGFAALAKAPGIIAFARPALRRFPGLLTVGANLSGKTRRTDGQLPALDVRG